MAESHQGKGNPVWVAFENFFRYGISSSFSGTTATTTTTTTTSDVDGNDNDVMDTTTTSSAAAAAATATSTITPITQWEREHFFMIEGNKNDTGTENQHDTCTIIDGSTDIGVVTPRRRGEIWYQQQQLTKELYDKYHHSSRTMTTKQQQQQQQQQEDGKKETEKGKRVPSSVPVFALPVPNEQALKVLRHFSPLIEITSGSNYYWSKVLYSYCNDDDADEEKKKPVDILVYDCSNDDDDDGNKNDNDAEMTLENGLIIRKGKGPEVLSTSEVQNSNRTLFLCCPDIDGDDDDDDDDDDNNNDDEQEEEDDDDDDEMGTSISSKCLNYYTGEYVIHVGELYDISTGNINMMHCPWGNTTSIEFQQRLASEFHCIFKMYLSTNWIHTRYAVTIWKRSKICPMNYQSKFCLVPNTTNKDNNIDDTITSSSNVATGTTKDVDDDDDDDDNLQVFRHIPPEEQLPVSIAAPCLAHLLE